MKRPTLIFGSLLYELDTTKGKTVSYLMYLLNILFLSLYVIGTFETLQVYTTYISAVELFLASVFMFEYVSRLDYAEDKLNEVTSIYSIADLLAVLPTFLIFVAPIVGQFAFLRSLQVLRVFRFIRIALEDNRLFNYKLTGKQVVMSEVAVTIFTILFLHAGVVLAFESPVNADFNNFWDSFYYSVVALTTTGFGNVVPQTLLGRISTSVGLISAVTVIPLLVIRAREAGGKIDACPRCGEKSHKEDANYCHQCAEPLDN